MNFSELIQTHFFNAILDSGFQCQVLGISLAWGDLSRRGKSLFYWVDRQRQACNHTSVTQSLIFSLLRLDLQQDSFYDNVPPKGGLGSTTIPNML